MNEIMSKRSRPQPISAPAPESFLPTFDFGVPSKQKPSAPLPPRKPVVSLSKRLAAFAFLNLEDIAEEQDDPLSHRSTAASPIDRISPPPSSTSTKSTRFWEFNRSNKQQQQQQSTTPASLPPMSSKAYATLVGGSATPSSAKPLAFTPPPSKVMRQAPSTKSPGAARELNTVQEQDQDHQHQQQNPKSLAIDLVSIFSVSPNSDDPEPSSPYSRTRFSFPMPPSSLPRRGSQSPLDPEMSLSSSSYHATSPSSIGSMTSPSSDYSFFSPLFSAGLTQNGFSQLPEQEYPSPISPLEITQSKATKPTATKKRHSIRRLDSLPPAAPPPHDSPPPTPTSTHSARAAAAAKRACPSPELDPELSAAESSASSILSVLMGASGADSSLSSAGEEDSDAESVVSVLGPMQRKRSEVDPVDVWANWGIGAPSRSDSIVTLTQRAYNSGMRGSISTLTAQPPLGPRNGSIGLGSPTGRNGSCGGSDVYGDWDQAIDDLFSFSSSSLSRKPSLASIAYAATADGAALASTSMNVVENTAFVMDDEMMQKLMETKFLVPTRQAPTPPKQPHAILSEVEGSRSNLSLDQTASSATPSASATSSARSSLDEARSTHSHHNDDGDDGAPWTPVRETTTAVVDLPVVAPLSLNKPTRARPAPIIASSSYPPVNLAAAIRPPRPPRATHNTGGGALLSATRAVELPAVSPLDITHRPPPTQSVPSESSLFSPSLSALSLSPQSQFSSPQSYSQSPQSPFTTSLDIDSWPTWSGADVAFERKRELRRPSAGAMTMISKFSDDTVEARPKKRRVGTAKRIKKSSAAASTTHGNTYTNTNGSTQAHNMTPGSSHTSYTFLGLKKKKDSSPSSSPTTQRPSRESVDSAESGASVTGRDRDGLRRPPLPVELFLRA